jgi:hypothetical protein
MPVSKEEYKERMRLGREKAARERAAGLRPPRKTRERASPPPVDDDTQWMDEAKTVLTSPPAPQNLTETPEFKAAVAAAVAEALECKTAEIMERLAAQRGGAGENDAGFARLFAAQLAELIDQDRRTKGQAARLSAEEIEARREAVERLERLLLDAYANQNEPQYDVMKPCYLEEQLIEPTWQNPATKILMRRQIVWLGIPNEHMHPANPVAEGIHAAFMRSIGGSTAPINRPDLGRPKLRIVGSSDVEGPPAVGKPKNIGMLKILGDTVQGQIIETNVLGTIAAPARQLA